MLPFTHLYTSALADGRSILWCLYPGLMLLPVAQIEGLFNFSFEYWLCLENYLKL